MFSGFVIMLEGGAGVLTAVVSAWMVLSDSDAVVVVESPHEIKREMDAAKSAMLNFESFMI